MALGVGFLWTVLCLVFLAGAFSGPSSMTVFFLCSGAEVSAVFTAAVRAIICASWRWEVLRIESPSDLRAASSLRSEEAMEAASFDGADRSAVCDTRSRTS